MENTQNTTTLTLPSLSKSEQALVTRFAKLIQGNEVDLEMFDRLFRNVEDANALAVLKNQLAEIATSHTVAVVAPEKPKRNYPEKRKSPTSNQPRKPGPSSKESDKDIKQNVQDLGKPEIAADPDFDL